MGYYVRVERAEELIITSEVKSRLESLFLTPDWRTIELLHKNASEVEFAEVSRDLEEPQQATVVREQTWRSKL